MTNPQTRPSTRTYICGHCSTGNHTRCPRLIVAGRNVEHGPTPCHCTNPQHDGQHALL